MVVSILDARAKPLMAPTGKQCELTARPTPGFEHFQLADNQDECLKYPGVQYAVDIRSGVDAWIKEQPVYMWKYANDSSCRMVYSELPRPKGKRLSVFKDVASGFINNAIFSNYIWF
jgi:hypothetical protein